MDFTRYSVEDFVLDESFQEFVADADSEAGIFWQAWLTEHPQQQAAAGEAYALVQALSPAKPYPVPAGLKQQELLRLRLRLQQAPVVRPRLRVQRRARLLWLSTLTLALLTVVGWWQWSRPGTSADSLARFTTANGQRRTIILPDSSVVTLNANSTLTTAGQWAANSPREVWLTGEAYFQVSHRATRLVSDIRSAPANVKFVVHAGELAISVVGTQFDVNSRPGATKVVLRSGKVIVDRQAGLTRENLAMQPGDLVETSDARPALTRRRVKPDHYSAWTQDWLRFRATPVREIVQLLRSSYNLRVEVSDPSILSQEITGDVPANSLEVLLPALAKALDVQVTRTGNTVRFHPSNH
ncbi:FecR domain-containing protein [Hymenobacter sp. J193]|uniref:FecR family protein n=1 Tax=Hymenobacter sp. J193 TaxID=2898429 RepID=UPI0021508AF6|nr:FecR domain-containing protein [Hymenobacter sp. J193]MCR5890912.1 FecR domain-containing protein [Hymenobacter sp. J193]MCR5890997.1 FecR domain-containing protein [Hymenobacter sp. J193]